MPDVPFGGLRGFLVFFDSDNAKGQLSTMRGLACALTVLSLAGCVSADKDAISGLLAVDPASAANAAAADPKAVTAAETDENYTDPMVVAMAGDPAAPDAAGSPVAAAYSETVGPDGNVVMQPARIQAGRSSIFSVTPTADPTVNAAPTNAAGGSIVPADLPTRGISPTSTSLFSAASPAGDPAGMGVEATPADGRIRSMPGLAPTTPRLKMRASLPGAAMVAQQPAPTAAHLPSAAPQPETVAADPVAVAAASEPAPQARKLFALPKWLSRAKK